MAMNKEDMASVIIEACKNVKTPLEAITEFSNAMKTYIEGNCEITYSWIGVLTPPPPAVPIPDPVESFKASISFADFILISPIVPDAITARVTLGTQIVSKLITGIITPVDSNFVVACLPLLSMPMLLPPDDSLVTPITAMEHFCGQVITIMKTMLKITPIAGAHNVPSFIGTGTAAMTLIE